MQTPFQYFIKREADNEVTNAQKMKKAARKYIRNDLFALLKL
ncbi:MAG: hypothetical protein AAGA86_00495 [Bacteroidota bacterium]